MIAPIKKSRPKNPIWHAGFLAMLPAIGRHARIAFRHLGPEGREDAVEEVIANALVAYVRLVKRGKADLAYPTVLARYAVAQVIAGRRVGSRLRIGDVLSRYAQRKKGFIVERLDKFDDEEGVWLEILVEDKHVGPAQTAAARIDLADWFDSMPDRHRQIAEALAVGGRTGDVAKRFEISPGRVSQMRQEFYHDWRQFQGEEPKPQ